MYHIFLKNMEIIFSILTLIREFKEYIKNYNFDDQTIDTVIKKILLVETQFSNDNLDLDDPIINANCQELYCLIAKVKRCINDYRESNKVSKFFNIGKLRDECSKFDNEMNQIFKNLKLNKLIDNVKLTYELKNHLENDLTIHQDILRIKRSNSITKKEYIYKIDLLTSKLENYEIYLKNISNNSDLILNNIENMNNFNKLYLEINDIKNDLCFLKQILNKEDKYCFFIKNIKFILYNIIFTFFIENIIYFIFLYIIYLLNHYLKDNKIYT